MKVAVIGAGVIGVSTAFELAADGHEVTVFERRSAAAEETSFANAGLQPVGAIAPWAAPGLPGRLLRSLFSSHAPAKLGWRLGGQRLAWLWELRRASRPDTHATHRSRLQQLAAYSRERQQELTRSMQLDYDRSAGCLLLQRTAKDQALAQPGLQWMRDAGMACSQLDAAAARLVEPALAADTEFAGAIHVPGDEVGNCREFTMLLKAAAQQLGATFEFNRTVAQVLPAPAATVSIAGESAPRRFDAVVVCAGLASAALLKPLGLALPLAAVRGYTITAQIREPMNAPISAVVDVQQGVSISRIGQRVRVAGGAEIGRGTAKNPAAIAALYQVLHHWFPGAAQLASTVQVWQGTQAMLPDGLPLLGASGLPGIWLNLGHGDHGWALACGSARATADLVAGRTPETSTDGLGLERLRR